ncbi:MAG: LysR family transcriptional regulator [Janthinobacterium lividum]
MVRVEQLASKNGKRILRNGTMTTDLNALMVFARVVEAKSFSEAARRLAMPVSTVSRRVADLEEEFGVRLLVRSTRHVRLTVDGEKVIEQARKLADINDAVEDAKARFLSKGCEMLRISAPPSISDTVLAPLVASFHASYPNISVKIFISGADRRRLPGGHRFAGQDRPSTETGARAAEADRLPTPTRR